MANTQIKPQPDAHHVVSKAVFRAADFLELTNAEIAKIIGVSEATVSRARNRGSNLTNNPKAQEIALLFVRLYRSLDAFIGGDDKISARWLRAQNKAFGKPPAEMIVTLSGLIAVIDYLDAARGVV